MEILLEGPGVFNLVRGIAPEAKDHHSVSRLVKDIERFGIPLYVVDDDLAGSNLSVEDLAAMHSRIISREEAARLIGSCETTIAL